MQSSEIKVSCRHSSPKFRKTGMWREKVQEEDMEGTLDKIWFAEEELGC